MFDLDLRSRKPIYEQLVDKLKELIVNGVIKADQQLPSVRTLAKDLTINPNTIQKAYRELENQGYIYSIKGKGSFVNSSFYIRDEEKIAELLKQLEKLLSEALYLGITVQELHTFIANFDQLKGGESEYDSNEKSK
ncbi:GntR family transcriptional regulator [Bacillus sp. 03113]|uniref:GntR family transcriptional regulator n=1 Tax=Bacillus sp. 03113 TaxID=2578211 RepID=UPI00114151F2|nr:GntR family transcriptional regulator [Bacillus sp. 03113]